MKNLKFNLRTQKTIFNKKFQTANNNIKNMFEWGYKKLPDGISKFTNKCLRKCTDCTKRLSCFDKKAIIQPIPKYLVWLGGSLLITPIFLIMYPENFVKLYSKSFNCVEPPEDRKEHYKSLVEKMNLKYPNRIHFLESPTVQFPSAFGSDTILGSIIIIPQQLSQFYDKEMIIEFENIYVPLKSLTHDEREYIIKRSGVLIPFENELDFVIGHEIGHIKKSHSIDILLGTISSVFATHFTLKYFNKFFSKMNRRPISSPYNYLLSLTLGLSVGMFMHQWKREIEADLESVNQLGLYDDALILNDMKAEQNKFVKKYYGDFNILENGDNLFHLEHPFPSVQKKYLTQSKINHTHVH